MKQAQYILLILTCVVAFFTGFIIGKDCMNPPSEIVTETIETTIDTISHITPTLQSELTLGTRRYTIPEYRFIGGGYGGVPRQRNENDSVCVDSIATTHYGTGAGGVPRSSRDSATVELPIIQRHYADSSYEAWVSGPIDPRLDSLNIYAPVTTITKQVWKPPKRWHIGPTIGYGCTPHGFEPYLGISVTYSIISW